MKNPAAYIAVDFGASGGRLMLGEFDGERIKLTETHRFINEPVRVNGHIFWDTFRLFHEMKAGMKKISQMDVVPMGIGIDTWGVDYGLLDAEGNLIGVPINYRDSRTDEMIAYADKIVPLKEIYDSTGIQFMPFNTVFQLLSDKMIRPAVYEKAERLLMMPDLMGYFLTGEKYNEYTIMSTSQLLNAENRTLDEGLLKRLGIKNELFSTLVEPGTVIGGLSGETAEETGLKDVKLIAVCGHDTASAVAGTPFYDERSAFLSCGTWSLMGLETDKPIISPLSYEYNFTNEGGAGNKIRFLKNINGLWIIQQLRAHYSERHSEISFAALAEAAEKAKNKSLRIDPADKRFVAPLNMMEAVKDYCVSTAQGEPADIGELASAVYNGLTYEYKVTVEKLEELYGTEINCVNMVGGGIRDTYLCRLARKVMGKKIVAGPVEASVLGNIIMQLIAAGHARDINEGREIIRNSFERTEYE